MIPDEEQLQIMLNELVENGYVDALDGVTPCTYTITNKGIEEGERLNEVI